VLYIKSKHYRSNLSRVAQSVQCLTTDWTAAVRFPAEAEDFSSSLCVQTCSGAHPASCTMGTGGSLPGAWCWPLTPFSAELKRQQELYVLSAKAPPWRLTGPLFIEWIYYGETKNKRVQLNNHSSTQRRYVCIICVCQWTTKLHQILRFSQQTKDLQNISHATYALV
jgi:hypothetical protein